MVNYQLRQIRKLDFLPQGAQRNGKQSSRARICTSTEECEVKRVEGTVRHRETWLSLGMTVDLQGHKRLL